MIMRVVGIVAVITTIAFVVAPGICGWYICFISELVSFCCDVWALNCEIVLYH